MQFKGASVVFILLLLTFLATFAIFVPLPHYNPDMEWFQGPSYAQRLMGEDIDAMPFDKLYYEKITSDVKSPFELSCQTDLDCRTIISKNQCRTYCGNKSPENSASLKQLELNRICDASGWKPEILSCRCVLGSCMDFIY